MATTRELNYRVAAKMADSFPSTMNKAQRGLYILQQRFAGVARQASRSGGGLGGFVKNAISLYAVGSAFRFVWNNTKDTQKALGELSSLGVKDLKSIERAAMDFTGKWAGYTVPEIIKSSYDIKSALSDLSDASVGEFAKISALTAKATKGGMDEITNTFTVAYGIHKPMMKKLSDIEWAQQFSGGLARTVQSFKTNGAQMSQAITALGATATTAKRPLEEQLAVLGMLQTTMPGAEAGTKYAAFTSSVMKASKKMGIKVTDSRGQLLGVIDILQAIKKKYPDLSKAEAAYKLQQAFGRKEAVEFVKQLMPQLDKLKGNINDVHGAMLDGTKQATDMAKAMDDGDIGAKWDVTSKKIANVAITIGNRLTPAILKVGDYTQSTIDWAVKNWGWLKWVIGTVTGAVLLYKATVATAMMIESIKGAITIYRELRLAILGAKVASDALNTSVAGGLIGKGLGLVGTLGTGLGLLGAVNVVEGGRQMHAATKESEANRAAWDKSRNEPIRRVKNYYGATKANQWAKEMFGVSSTAALSAAQAQQLLKAHPPPKGYANGGLVTQQQIAWIAEHNRPELVLPLTNKPRTQQLLTAHGLGGGNVVIQNTFHIEGGKEPQQIAQQIVQITDAAFARAAERYFNNKLRGSYA